MPDLLPAETSKSNKQGMLKWLWLTLLIVTLDLGTKALATQYLEFATPVKLLPFFNLTLLHNTGAAFSFLSDAGGWQRWFFTAIALVTIVVLLVWMARLPKDDRWVAISLALIMGGAIGNVYDRIVQGYVIDFLHFHWKDAYFPAFNIADSAITVGAIMMGIEVLFFDDKSEPGSKQGSEQDGKQGKNDVKQDMNKKA